MIYNPEKRKKVLCKNYGKIKIYQKNLFLPLTKAKTPIIIGLQFDMRCMHLMQNCDMHSSIVPIGGFPFLCKKGFVLAPIPAPKKENRSLFYS